MSDEISTEELLTMRVVPEQRADLAVVQAAFDAVPRNAEALSIEQLAGMLELLSDGDFQRVGVLSNRDARALVAEVMRLRRLSFDELVAVAVK